MIRPIDVAELKALVANATPLPWAVVDAGEAIVSGTHSTGGEDMSIQSLKKIEEANRMPDGDPYSVDTRPAWEEKQAVVDSAEVVGCSEWMRARREDFELIVAAVNALPQLLAAYERHYGGGKK